MKPIAGLIAGIAIIAAIVQFVGVASLLPTIAKLNLRYFLQAVAASIAILLFSSMRLKLVLNAQKYPLSLWNATKIHIATNTVNLITPVVKMGGIPLKVDYISKTGVPSIISCASVIGEMVTETISFFSTFLVLVVYLVVTGWLPGSYIYLESAFLIVFGVLLFVALNILLSRSNLEKFIRNFVLRFATVDAKKASYQFNCSITSYIGNRLLLYSTLSLSFLCRLLEFARINLIFLALGFNVSLSLIFTIWVLEAFFSGIPWLPGGVGLVEIGSISALTLMNIPLLIATPLILINRLVSHWTPLLVGGFVMSSLSRNGIKCEI